MQYALMIYAEPGYQEAPGRAAASSVWGWR
jgi:hypothetical protein